MNEVPMSVFFAGLAVGVFALGLLIALLAFVNSAVSRWANRKLRSLREKFVRMGGGVPWLEKDLVYLGQTHGQHQVWPVSRHHLAEGGLQCPLCETVVAAGDFSHVYRTMVDGRENEVLLCQGRRIVEGNREVPCNTTLLASPDTEHGDHLNDKGEVDAYAVDPPEYYRFVRVAAGQALREKWGVNAVATDNESVVDVTGEKPPANPGRKDDVIVGVNPMAYIHALGTPEAEKIEAAHAAKEQTK